jgi:malate synthase
VHAQQRSSINFYIPKTESVNEIHLYKDVFDASRGLLPHLKDADIRAVILVESLPAVWQMEEMLYALGKQYYYYIQSVLLRSIIVMMISPNP